MPRWSLDHPVLALVLGLGAAVLMLRSTPRLGAHHGRTGGMLMLCLAMLAYLNAYFAYLPHVGDVAGPRPWPVATAQSVAAVRGPGVSVPHPGGAVVALGVTGVVSRFPRRDALVYLPPQSRAGASRSCTCCMARLVCPSTGSAAGRPRQPHWLRREQAGR